VNKPTKKTKPGFVMAKLFTDSFPAFDPSEDISDATSEVPEWPQEIEGWTERPLDLNMLWEVLEKHKKVMQEQHIRHKGQRMRRHKDGRTGMEHGVWGHRQNSIRKKVHSAKVKRERKNGANSL